MEAISTDREREADVFEELDTTHQREFLEDRADAQVAEVVARMEPDDAADCGRELARGAAGARARAAPRGAAPPRRARCSATTRPPRAG